MYKYKNNGNHSKNSRKRKFYNNKPGRYSNYANEEANVNYFIEKSKKEVNTKTHTVQKQFSDFNINKVLLKNVLSKGFTKPTPIQDLAIPYLLENKNLLGLANTGTGKTAAYLIPLLQKVIDNPNNKILIMCPTRELASQINTELYSLTKELNINSVVITGGTSIKKQINKLNQKYNFAISTPGRLIDLINRKQIQLKDFTTVVIDEVDRMFDMGFVKDIDKILSLMPKNKQSIFFSATINSKIEGLINQNASNIVKVNVVNKATSTNIDQKVISYTSTSDKNELLHSLLIKQEVTKSLIFGRTKHGVKNLVVDLSKRGFKVQEIHGNKKQNARNKALEQFKLGEVSILVATDVASRGIDVNDISHVINYEIPDTYDEYIHRIGRTGRANKKGTAYSFVKAKNS